jgi:hypothetical protein
MSVPQTLLHTTPDKLVGKKAYRVRPFLLSVCNICRGSIYDFTYTHEPVHILSVDLAKRTLRLTRKHGASPFENEECDFFDNFWSEWPKNLAEGRVCSPSVADLLGQSRTCRCSDALIGRIYPVPPHLSGCLTFTK